MKWIIFMCVFGALSVRIKMFLLKESVIFKKLSDIHTSRSHWKLTLVEDLTNYVPSIIIAQSQTTHLQVELRILLAHLKGNVSQSWKPELNELASDLRNLVSEIGELSSTYRDLEKLDSQPKRHRRKRSLIPLIGTLGSYLFGMVSESDLNAIKRNVHKLFNNQNRIVHVLNESLSLMNISRGEIKQNRDKINEVIKSVEGLNYGLSRIQLREMEEEHMMKILVRSITALRRVRSNFWRLFRNLRTFQLQLNSLSQGRLSPIVINPETLLEILKEIKSQLRPPFILPKDPSSNLWHYYKTLTVSTAIRGGKLVMVIKIPLVDTNSRLELFELFNLHFPGEGNLATSTAQYQIEAKGLAINYGRTEYMLLSEQDVAGCNRQLDFYCELNNVRYMTNAKRHCITSLFISDNESSKQNCETQVFLNKLLPIPQYLKDGFWAISTKEKFKMAITCDSRNEPSIAIDSPITIFRLNDSCSATSNYFILPASSTFKSETSLRSPTIRTVNVEKTTLWKPLKVNYKNLTTIKIPNALKAMKSIPLSNLVAELKNAELGEFAMNQTTPWYWYVFGFIILVLLTLGGIFGFKFWVTKRRNPISNSPNQQGEQFEVVGLHKKRAVKASDKVTTSVLPE